MHSAILGLLLAISGAAAQCSVNAAGSPTSVQDGETSELPYTTESDELVYLDAADTDTFERQVTIIGCQPTTSDADGSAINTDTFTAELVDPVGNSYECDTNPPDEPFDLTTGTREWAHQDDQLTCSILCYIYLPWCGYGEHGGRQLVVSYF